MKLVRKRKKKKLKYKNYYRILELSGPRVTEEEIKLAYRKLTKIYHPDVNPNEEERFKDIAEAWDTLKDKDKKRRYNIRYYMHIMQNGIDFSGVKKRINEAGESEFVKIFLGDYLNQKEHNADPSIRAQEKLDVEIPITISLEEAFNGVTKSVYFKPHGEQEKTVTVRIPRGMRTGNSIKLVGEGKKSKISSKKGDMYIKIDVLNSPRYELIDNNLQRDVKISFADAVLGTEIPIESIDATYKLKIPAGTQVGEKISIKDAGFINQNGLRGNFIAKILIDVPKNVSQEEIELYKALKEINNKS